MKVITQKVGAIKTNCYIVYDETTQDGVIIDPGANADILINIIKSNNINLRYILLTHWHFDHVLAVNDIKAYKKDAPIVIHESDAMNLKPEVMFSLHSFVKDFYSEPIPDILATDGYKLRFGDCDIEYIFTPGHTTGSSVISINNMLFTGDTLFAGECGRCDLLGGDFNKMLQSLKKLYNLDGDYIVYPGHEHSSTLEIEREHNPYMRQAIGL